MIKLHVDWYGPLGVTAVRAGRFPAAWLEMEQTVYLWGATKRGDAARHLYLGQAIDPIARQRQHMAGDLGERLEAVEELGWRPCLWVGWATFNAATRSAVVRDPDRVKALVNGVEQALIYSLKPDWNRAHSGYTALTEPVTLTCSGKVPAGVPATLRLDRGLHV